MSTTAHYLLAALAALLIAASCQLDGPDEATTEAIVQADKADAIAAARQAAAPRIAAIAEGQP